MNFIGPEISRGEFAKGKEGQRPFHRGCGAGANE